MKQQSSRDPDLSLNLHSDFILPKKKTFHCIVGSKDDSRPSLKDDDIHEHGLKQVVFKQVRCVNDSVNAPKVKESEVARSQLFRRSPDVQNEILFNIVSEDNLNHVIMRFCILII